VIYRVGRIKMEWLELLMDLVTVALLVVLFVILFKPPWFRGL